MLKFQGEGNTGKINIRMYGDGVQKETFINLTKPPFDLNFEGFFPKNVRMSNIAMGVPKSVTMQNDTLHIMFDAIPPASNPSTEEKPFTSFSVEFIYGADITT